MRAACLIIPALVIASALAQTQKPSASSQPAEVTYKGTLVDAGCASSGNTATNNTAGGSCAPSANTSQFAIRLADGRTLKFDSVGNMRAQDALKARKKWTDAAAAGKPVRVKVHGMMSEDTLTVTSID